MHFPTVELISECFIKPKVEAEESKQPYYLPPSELLALSVHYNQNALFYAKPKGKFHVDKFLESLKDSLALTLVHFYPLAGQLVSQVDEAQNQCFVFVDCNKGRGVRFVRAVLCMTVSDILSPDHVPALVKSFFDHNNGEVNYDGLTRPILSVQVTELVDGIVIGCSMNHCIADGTSFWQFWKIWSEIQRANGKSDLVLRLPNTKRWIPDGYGTSDLALPFIHPVDFISRYWPPELKERFFHFSYETVAELKAKANQEVGNNQSKVSSFQALSAFVWRSIIRAMTLAPNEVIQCKLTANCRSRLDPPLPEEYFGVLIYMVEATTTVGELLEGSLGSAALLLHHSVVNLTDKVFRDFVHGWFKSPYTIQFDKCNDTNVTSTVQIGNSPRFDIYGNEFAGLGKPIAVRTGPGNKYAGKVNAYAGSGGGGSVDLEICLSPDSMRALESDEEFMAAVSSPLIHYS